MTYSIKLQKDESQSADHDPASDEEEAKQMLAKLKTMAQQGESAAAQEAKENEEEIRKQASFFVDLTQVGCLTLCGSVFFMCYFCPGLHEEGGDCQHEGHGAEAHPVGTSTPDHQALPEPEGTLHGRDAFGKTKSKINRTLVSYL